MSADHDSPAVEWMTKMRNAFQAAITEDDMREIARGIALRAKKGDREAMRLLLTYALPQPRETTRHERVSAQVHVQARKALPNGTGRVVQADDGEGR